MWIDDYNYDEIDAKDSAQGNKMRLPKNTTTKSWVKWCKNKFKKENQKFHPYDYLSKKNRYYNKYF